MTMNSEPSAPRQAGTGPVGDLSVLKGIGLVCLGVSLFPVMNATVKYLSTDYSWAQIIWVRYLGHTIAMALMFLPGRGLGILRSHWPAGQIIRSGLLFGATAFYFAALRGLDLPVAAAIQFTAPFIVTALSWPLLGERVGARRWLAVALGFGGAFIIIRPWQGDGSQLAPWAIAFVIVSATSYALYQLMTRKLALNDAPETSIMYVGLVGSLAVAPFAVMDFQWPATLLDYFLFASMGLVGGLGHYFLTWGFAHAPASLLSPFGYTQLIGSVILGYAVFGYFPDNWVWSGAAIIVSSGIYMTYREYRAGNRANRPKRPE